MKPLRPDTFELTLPDGKKVTCWRKDADLIRADVHRTGEVGLVQDPATGIYSRVAPNALLPGARRVG